MVRTYAKGLKDNARCLRQNMTDSEQRLWSRLRGKQLLGVQFYRQKPLGPYIVDFYAPRVNLVVEVDGSQHFEAEHLKRDEVRDQFLAKQGLRVLRFDSRQMLIETDAVVETVFRAVAESLKG